MRVCVHAGFGRRGDMASPGSGVCVYVCVCVRVCVCGHTYSSHTPTLRFWKKVEKMLPMRISISSTVSTLALPVSRELSLVRTNWIPHINAHDA